MVCLSCLSLLLTSSLAANVTERLGRVSVFPCRTEYLETNHLYQRTVHTLRPQDVDIVASVGDSITAGTGAPTLCQSRARVLRPWVTGPS